jgi:vanillate O-demethylase monooxygenase subunit
VDLIAVLRYALFTPYCLECFMTSDTAIAAQYPRHCSFNEGDWRILSQNWFPVAAASSIAAGPVAVTLLDVALVVYRTGGAIRVARDVCPHRSVPLSMGKVVGDDLICAYHGLHYGPDGQCRRIPSQPDIKPPVSRRRAVRVGLDVP